ncbi:MAG: TIR domain-containing protein [Pseudomonadota bacterium]
MADIFISYKREDKHLAEDTIHALKEAGFSVWYDDRIDPHTSWDETIEREIAAAEAVVVLWTPRSVASQWVRTEADYAAQHRKIVPVMLEQSAVPLAYRRTQFADLTQWDGNPEDRNFQKLAGWVRGLVDGSGSGPGSIGASTFGEEDSRSRNKKGGAFVPLMALLGLALIGGAGALYAFDIIGPGMIVADDTGSQSAEQTPVQAPLQKGAPLPDEFEQTLGQPPNTRPVAVDDAASTQSPDAATLSVLANDSDAENDVLEVSAIAGFPVTPGETVSIGRASVRLSGRDTLVVTPDADYTGTLEFSYAVTDGNDTAQATVTVEVTAPPPPACFDLRITVADTDPNGNDWDVVAFGSASRPDPEVTSRTHPSVDYDCEDAFACNRNGLRNEPLQEAIFLRVLDDDVGSSTEPIGSGTCAIPSTGCRIDRATVDIIAAACPT